MENFSVVFKKILKLFISNHFQVLPERTHPEVMMSGGGGYLLSGIVVDNTEPEGHENGFAKSDHKYNGRKKQRRN